MKKSSSFWRKLGNIIDLIDPMYLKNIFRSSLPEVLCKKGVLRNFVQFTGKHLCQGLFLIKKETLAQVFSCEFYDISKNTFFHGTPLVAASAFYNNEDRNTLQKSNFFPINSIMMIENWANLLSKAFSEKPVSIKEFPEKTEFY